MKLFEIPVYALSPEALKKRAIRKMNEVRCECLLKNCNAELTDLAVDNETFPQRLWPYNHIVGYIVIIIEGQDITFKSYVPHRKIHRYQWRSEKKKLLRDSMATGYHFYVPKGVSVNWLRGRIQDYLDEISKPFLNKGYHIDRESFDTVEPLIDYERLIELMK